MTEESPWKGRVAVVTGGASGLGFALSKKLVNLGVKVAVLDFNAQLVEKAVGELGAAAHGLTADVTKPEAVQQAIAWTLSRFSRIDILVNSAGITGQTNRRSHEVALEDFDRVFNLNLKACLITFQAVVPHMMQRGYGRVLNVSSIAGKEGNAGMLAYSSSKAALIGMTKVQGKEYAETGITVNAIAPAVVQTALVDALPQEQVDYMTAKIPMKRCGTLEEFAEMAAFIVSPGNSFTTGFTFDLSGGRAVY